MAERAAARCPAFPAWQGLQWAFPLGQEAVLEGSRPPVTCEAPHRKGASLWEASQAEAVGRLQELWAASPEVGQVELPSAMTWALQGPLRASKETVNVSACHTEELQQSR